MSRGQRTTLYVTTAVVWAVYVTVQIMGVFSHDEWMDAWAAILRAVATVLTCAATGAALLHPILSASAAFYLAGAAAAAKPECNCAHDDSLSRSGQAS